MQRDELFGDDRKGTYCSIPIILLSAPSTILPASLKNIWQAIANRIGVNAGSWPGYSTLARDVGGSLKGVKDGVKELEIMGLLTKERRFNEDGTNKSNFYVLALPDQLLALEKISKPKHADYLAAFHAVVVLGDTTSCDAYTRVVKRLHQGRVVKSVHQGGVAATRGMVNGVHQGRVRATPEVVKGVHPNHRKEPPKEPLHENPPKETPPEDRGRATPGEQTTTHPAVSAASSEPAPAPEGSGPASGGSEPSEASGTQERSAPQPAACEQPADAVRRMILEAKKSGVEMSSGPEALRVARANLLYCVQHRPLLKYIWGQITWKLVNRKGFSSKTLEWLCKGKTQENGEIKYGWQTIGHWIYDEDNTSFNRSIWDHWSELAPATTYGDPPVHRDILNRTIGGLPPYKEIPPSPWNKKHLDPAGERWGALCRVEKALGDDCYIVYFDKWGEVEPVQAKLSELISANDDTPPNPRAKTEQKTEPDEEDELQALLSSLK